MYSIKLTLCCTDTTAYALVLINDCCTTAQASCSFFLNLFLCEYTCITSEWQLINSWLLSWALTACIVILLNAVIILIKFNIIVRIPAYCKWAVWLYISVNRYSPLLTCRNSINSKFRTCIYITTDKDIWLCCLICNLVSNRIITMPEFNLSTFKKAAPFNCLSDRHYHIAAFYCHSLILIVLWIESSISILNRSTFLKYDACNLAIFCNDFFRSPATNNIDTFWFSSLNFFWKCWHNVSCLKRYLWNLRWTAAYCCSGYINGNITTTNDYCVTCKLIAFIISCNMEKFNTSHNSLSIFSGNASLSTALTSNCNIKRFIALFAKLCDCDILTYFNTTFYLNTHSP